MSSHNQRVNIDGVCNSSIHVISGVPQGSDFGPLLFMLYIADLPGLLQNVLDGYADDSTLFYRIPHPRDRSSVVPSLNEDLAMISNWCSRWGMLVNQSKTRGCLFLVLVRLNPCSLTWSLSVILDSKLAFKKQFRETAASSLMRVGILRKTMRVFRDVAVVGKCFWTFILPVL